MHPIEQMLETTMTQLKEMVDVNTIVGEPFVTPTGATVIPISRLSFGVTAGGGEYAKAPRKEEGGDFPFAAGSASGVSIAPVAFMVADGEGVKLLTVQHRNALDKLVENTPGILCELKNMVKEVCTCDKKGFEQRKHTPQEPARHKAEEEPDA